MSRPRRGYSDAEVDEYVRQDQERRAGARTAERIADPQWTLIVDPDWPELGMVWVKREG